MPIAWWVFAAALVAVLVMLAFLYRRRRLLTSRGAIEMSVYRGGKLFGGWMLGVASYSGTDLQWHRMASFSASPSLRLGRRTTVLLDRHEAASGDALWMPPDPIVLDLQTPNGPVTVAVPASALTGLLSWWESAPPSWAADGVGF